MGAAGPVLVVGLLIYVVGVVTMIQALSLPLHRQRVSRALTGVLETTVGFGVACMAGMLLPLAF